MVRWHVDRIASVLVRTGPGQHTYSKPASWPGAPDVCRPTPRACHRRPPWSGAIGPQDCRPGGHDPVTMGGGPLSDRRAEKWAARSVTPSATGCAATSVATATPVDRRSHLPARGDRGSSAPSRATAPARPAGRVGTPPQGGNLMGGGTADPQRGLPAHATQLVTSQGHAWLAGKAFLTAVRRTYRPCDSREPVKQAVTVTVCAGQ